MGGFVNYYILLLLEIIYYESCLNVGSIIRDNVI